MSLSSLSFIYFSFYTVAVVLAFLRARAGAAPKPRNSFAAMIIGAVGTALIYGSALLSPGGTVPLVLVAALALVPSFLLGLGNLVGLAIATWRPHMLAQLGLGGVALGVPLLAILGLGSEATPHSVQSTTRVQDRESVPQRLEVTGRLGRYPVSFPTSPQINTRYTCLLTDGSIGQCQTDFASAPDLSAVPGDVPIFYEITVARKSIDCNAPCITFRQLAQWCQSRSDVAFTEWCRNAPSEELAFSYAENRNVEDVSARGWQAADVDMEQGSIECHEDQALCRARFDIARNLQVTVWMPDAQPESLAARFESAQDYVTRLWAEMQTDR